MNNYWENFCDALFFFLLEHFCKNISKNFHEFFMFVLFFCCIAAMLCTQTDSDWLSYQRFWHLVFNLWLQKHFKEKCLSLLLFYFSFRCKRTTALGQQTASNFWISHRIFDGTILSMVVCCLLHNLSMHNHQSFMHLCLTKYCYMSVII